MATALLTKEADELTLGQDLLIMAPHSVETLLRTTPDIWMTNFNITHYQALLLDQLRVKILQIVALSPATLLPETSDSTIQHDCLEIPSTF